MSIIKPTEENFVIVDSEVFKDIVKEIATEMVRWSTSQWSYTDIHDIMGDGKRLPKAQKMYRQHYDFVRSCLKRHYIYKEKKD
tara:strand:- start:225 stop:473 length:249 start_codon:yes stop_codon:yes gene_type:complete